MDQNFNYFDLKNEENSLHTNFASQLEVKSQIEQQIQKDVQKLLGTMMGPDKVVVSVTTDIDFTQENREENLVAPVNEEDNEGIAISVERITEAYTGDGVQAGGVTGTGDTDTVTIQEINGDGTGDYERTEERVNNEVNRIRKEISESPYKIRDIGIQVMVEPPDPENPNSLPEERINDIEQILSTIVRTSIDKNANEEPLTEQDIQDKIVVSVQPFNGKINFEEENQASSIPLWVYLLFGAASLIIIILLFILWRRKREKDDLELFDEEVEEESEPTPDIWNEKPEVLDEKTMKRKQIEEMAKEKPDEFAKLLRTWLYED
jgi:flagellar M-ring protein FliF